MRMTRAGGLLLVALLAGCERKPPAPAAAPVSQQAEPVPDAPAPPVTIKASFQCPRPVVAGEPILPMDAPLTDLQKLICAEPELALLDRHVHEAYLAMRLRSGVDRGSLSKAEAKWQADRETCLKADDPRDCVAEATRTRLVELALQDPNTVAGTQVAFSCKGTGTPLTAAVERRGQRRSTAASTRRSQCWASAASRRSCSCSPPTPASSTSAPARTSSCTRAG